MTTKKYLSDVFSCVDDELQQLRDGYSSLLVSITDVEEGIDNVLVVQHATDSGVQTAAAGR